MKHRYHFLILAISLFLTACGTNETPNLADTESNQIDAETNLDTPPSNSVDTKPNLFEAEPVLISEALSSDNLRGHDVMDFLFFAKDSFEFEDENLTDGCYAREFEGPAEGYATITEYVNVLCNQYNFTLVGTPYYKDYGKTAFFDFVLQYTGDRPGVNNSCQGVHSKNYGAVMIYGTVERKEVEGYVYYEEALMTGDDGYRAGNSAPISVFPGDSLFTELYQLGDGSFQTGDGRLTTTLGKANILADGVSSSYNADYSILSDKNHNVVSVSSSEGIYQSFYIPSSLKWAAGLCPSGKFIVDSNRTVSDKGIFDDIPQRTWDYLFAIEHNTDYIVPVRGFMGEMTGLSMRCMYVDDKVGIFYTCATFQSAPYKIESLIAIDMDVTPTESTPDNSSSGFSSDDCTACFGSGRCSICNGSGSVRKLLAGTREWVDQSCTSCRPSGSGNCSRCGGSGDK